MAQFSELADILVKCRVVPRKQWDEAAQAAADLPQVLDRLAEAPPNWWDGPPPTPPGLTEYQRDIILRRYTEDELKFLRRDLALNQFVLLDKLGHGGQGEVYRARQLNPPRFAAVKVLIRDTESRRKRFEQEARAMIRIQHPSVARFYLYERIRDANAEPTDEYLIAMEFVQGTDLQRVVRQIGPVPWPYAVHWIAELLGGLDTIHKSGFIHRDVKPENVMIVGPLPGEGVTPNDTAAKLLDFGAVNRVGETVEPTGTSRVFIGTMEYAAPEQWHGEMDVASDLYALGGTLFFMLAGRTPFKKDRRDPRAYMHAHLNEAPPDLLNVNAAVPPELNRLYTRMMAKNFLERGTAAELLAEFRQLRPRAAANAVLPAPDPAFNPSRAKSTEVEEPPPTQVVPVHRPAPAVPDETIQNPIMRVLDGCLTFLERVFIPEHLRPPREDDVALVERAVAILRQPLVLILLVLLVAFLIILL